MKAIVLGAAGAMASVAIRDLLEFAENVSLTAADARPVKLLNLPLHPATLDVQDELSTARLIEGHDVVLNCVPYPLNPKVMRAALRARVPYVDLGGLYHVTLQQFALHEEFLRHGVTAILGMGSTPGITNVMAGALVQLMDCVDEIHVRVACHDESATGLLPIPYSLDTILDEFALEPIVFREGQPATVPVLSGSEIIEFPSPVGQAEAFHTLHSEVAMFPRSFTGLREASFKIAFPQAFNEKMRFLVGLGFASRDNGLRGVSPREMLLALAAKHWVPTSESEPQDCDVLRVWVKGKKQGKEISGLAESVILPHPLWRVAAGSRDTGVPLSIVAQMLARRIIQAPGVHCPETCVPSELFWDELSRRGIRVTFKIQ